MNNFYKTLYENDKEGIENFLKNGFYVNEVDESRRIPLICAIFYNNDCKIINLLLKYGADVDIVDDYTHSALIKCVLYCKILLENNVNLEFKDRYGHSALMKAVIYEDINMIRLLLKYKANINTIDIYGLTPLKRAILYQNTSIIQFLLENGADIKDILQFTQQLDIVKLILIEEKNRLTVVYNDIMKELVKKSISVEFENCNNILDDDVRRYILEFL